MKTPSVLILTLLLSLSFACGKAVPTEISKACAAENNGRYIEVMGFFYPPDEVLCTNFSGRMRCRLELRETPPGVTYLPVEIIEGRGPNSIEKPGDNYVKDHLNINDSAGRAVKFSDKVKLIGTMNRSWEICHMKVDRIERAS
jgi:hypothetical protein